MHTTRQLFLSKQAAPWDSQQNWGRYKGEGFSGSGQPISLAEGQEYKRSVFGPENQKGYTRESWQGLADRYGPYFGAGAVGGVGGAALGGALFGRSPFGAGVGSALGAAGGLYLADRYQKGAFNPLFDKGGLTMANLGKALWGNVPSKGPAPGGTGDI
jgi:hypothetical protein